MQNIYRKPVIKILQSPNQGCISIIDGYPSYMNSQIHIMLHLHWTQYIYMFAFEAIIWHNWSPNMEIKSNISHAFKQISSYSNIEIGPLLVLISLKAAEPLLMVIYKKWPDLLKRWQKSGWTDFKRISRLLKPTTQTAFYHLISIAMWYYLLSYQKPNTYKSIIIRSKGSNLQLNSWHKW